VFHAVEKLELPLELHHLVLEAKVLKRHCGPHATHTPDLLFVVRVGRGGVGRVGRGWYIVGGVVWD